MASTSSATGEVVASTSSATAAITVAEPVEAATTTTTHPPPPRWLSLSKPKQQKPTIMTPPLARTCSPCQRKNTLSGGGTGYKPAPAKNTPVPAKNTNKSPRRVIAFAGFAVAERVHTRGRANNYSPLQVIVGLLSGYRRVML
jgi:hypothetical protein